MSQSKQRHKATSAFTQRQCQLSLHTLHLLETHQNTLAVCCYSWSANRGPLYLLGNRSRRSCIPTSPPSRTQLAAWDTWKTPCSSPTSTGRGSCTKNHHQARCRNFSRSVRSSRKHMENILHLTGRRSVLASVESLQKIQCVARIPSVSDVAISNVSRLNMEFTRCEMYLSSSE